VKEFIFWIKDDEWSVMKRRRKKEERVYIRQLRRPEEKSARDAGDMAERKIEKCNNSKKM
jgi:hypothetical protein